MIVWKTPRKKDIHLIRFTKYQLLKLLRSPEGARRVAAGFAIGFGLEMIMPFTAYLAYLLLIPLVRAVKGSLSASVIGNLIMKATFLPVLMAPVAYRAIHAIFPHNLEPHGRHAFMFYIAQYQRMLLVMILFGVLFGIFSYFPVYWLYFRFQQKRIEKRKQARAQRSVQNA